MNKFLQKATEPDDSKRLYSEAMVMKVLARGVLILHGYQSCPCDPPESVGHAFHTVW